MLRKHRMPLTIASAIGSTLVAIGCGFLLGTGVAAASDSVVAMTNTWLSFFGTVVTVIGTVLVAFVKFSNKTQLAVAELHGKIFEKLQDIELRLDKTVTADVCAGRRDSCRARIDETRERVATLEGALK